LFHLALRDEWREAIAGGTGAAYRRSTLGQSLDEVGFIHCSFAEQVPTIADLVYRGRSDVVLLEIDPDSVPAEIRVEAADDVEGSPAFPHIYGPLPVDAVVRATEVPLDATTGRIAVEALLAGG
jgi:glutathione S-transferase